MTWTKDNAANPKSVHAAIIAYGDDSTFVPTAESEPVEFLPGSGEKVEALRRRVESGQSLWNPQDKLRYDPNDDDDLPPGSQYDQYCERQEAMEEEEEYDDGW